jgi:hypothetical protein
MFIVVVVEPTARDRSGVSVTFEKKIIFVVSHGVVWVKGCFVGIVEVRIDVV